MADKQITIKIVGDASSVSAAMREASGASDTLDKSLGTVVKTAAGFALGTAVTKAPGFLLDAAKAAAADEQSMNQLKQAVTNADGSYDKYGKTIDDAISKGQKLAFSDDETRSALTTLISETGSTEEAMKRLTTAQDLARGTGMSLDNAARLLGKTTDENTSTLARYGITVEKGATAQDLLNAVDEKYKGQAGTYADSAAGQMAIMQDKAGELQESLGYILLPILAAVTVAMTAIVDAIATHVVPALQSFADSVQPIVGFVGDNLVPIIAGLTAGLLTLAATALPAVIAAATTFVTTTAPELIAQGIALALAYAPLTLAIIAIGVVVAALALAWQSDFGGIQEKTQAVIDFLSPYISAFMTGIQTVFETVWPIVSQIVTTYIGAVRLEIETALTVIQTIWGVVFPAIQAVVETVFPIIAGVVQTYIEAARLAIELGMAAIQLIWGPAWDAIKAVATAIWDTATGIAAVVATGIAAVSAAIDAVMGPLRTAWETSWGGIKGVATDIWDETSGIRHVVSSGIGGVKSAIDTVMNGAGGVLEIWRTAWGTVQSVVETVAGVVKSIWNGIAGGVNAGINAWNALSFQIPHNKVTDFLHIGGLGWDTPNLDTLPLIGDASGSGAGGGSGGPNNANAYFMADSITNAPPYPGSSGGGGVGPPGQKPVSGGGGPTGGGLQKPGSGGGSTIQAAADRLARARQGLANAANAMQAALASGDPTQIARAQYAQNMAILEYRAAFDAYQSAVMAPPSITPGTGAPGSGGSGGSGGGAPGQPFPTMPNPLDTLGPTGGGGGFGTYNPHAGGSVYFLPHAGGNMPGSYANRQAFSARDLADLRNAIKAGFKEAMNEAMG